MGQIVIAGLRRAAGPERRRARPRARHGVPRRARSQARRHAATRPRGSRPTAATRSRGKPVPVAGEAWSKPDRGRRPGRARDHRRPGRSTLVFPSELKRQLALRTLADWVVRPRLLKIPGVAQVAHRGRRPQAVPGARRSRPRCTNTASRCRRSRRRSRRTTSTPAAASRSTAARRSRSASSAGSGPRPEQVVADLTPDRREGRRRTRPILLEQVARVAEGAQVKRGDASVNGEPGVVLTVAKQPHVDTRGADRPRCKRRFARSSRRCRPTSSSTPTCSSFATSSTAASSTSARRWSIGAVLVLIVLFLFLLNFRTTFISLTAIPLSLVDHGAGLPADRLADRRRSCRST